MPLSQNLVVSLKLLSHWQCIHVLVTMNLHGCDNKSTCIWLFIYVHITMYPCACSYVCAVMKFSAYLISLVSERLSIL
jgi:hypothetical protein